MVKRDILALLLIVGDIMLYTLYRYLGKSSQRPCKIRTIGILIFLCEDTDTWSGHAQGYMAYSSYRWDLNSHILLPVPGLLTTVSGTKVPYEKLSRSWDAPTFQQEHRATGVLRWAHTVKVTQLILTFRINLNYTLINKVQWNQYGEFTIFLSVIINLT